MPLGISQELACKPDQLKTYHTYFFAWNIYELVRADLRAKQSWRLALLKVPPESLHFPQPSRFPTFSIRAVMAPVIFVNFFIFFVVIIVAIALAISIAGSPMGSAYIGFDLQTLLPGLGKCQSTSNMEW
jgi:hypothetical protein